MDAVSRALQVGFIYSQKRFAQEILYSAVQLRAVPFRSSSIPGAVPTRETAFPGVQLQEIPFKASPIPGVSTGRNVSTARAMTHFLAEQMGRLRLKV